ncbi:MAG: hypothetical protein JSW61_05295 [Candidatus Thorarchaeota archaeon]|nr:MAG: hypothetical protein JSW61_05295 [Candidatus Thorarchaeota archaeon]
MRKEIAIVVLVSFALLALTSTAAAHVPIGIGTGDTLDDAVEIPDATKSWVIYSEVHEASEGHYYRFHMHQGERIRFTLMIPNYMSDTGFAPGAVLMGPGLVNQGVAPSYVEVANGTGVIVIEGVDPEHAEYEGFTPSTFRVVVDVNIIAPESGEYYLVVHDADMGGPFGMAIGYVESFTLDEWILVPVNVIGIYLWQGQSLAIVFAPMLATVIVGLWVVATKKNEDLKDGGLTSWLGLLAGVLFLGSAASFGFQIVYSALQSAASAQILISVLFALIPAILGLMTIRIVLDGEAFQKKSGQIKLVGIGILSLFGWAGLLIGPVLAVAAGSIKYANTR